MSQVFVPFWRLRQHAVAEEAVREGSRRRRTDAPWPLAPGIVERLRDLLVAEGLDPARPILAVEPADRDGFVLSQE
jgi:hypothetical protein